MTALCGALYWNVRYARGGTSGLGSRGHLGAFKADTLNALAAREGIRSVVDWGCGDGEQAARFRFPRYLGLDVSPDALARCRERCAGDDTKRFALVDEAETAEMALSLDVIYHLIDDAEYAAYMRRLFESASRMVVVYSTDYDKTNAVHVRHRAFTDWVRENAPGWRLRERIPNRYPPTETVGEGSSCAFYVYVPVEGV